MSKNPITNAALARAYGVSEATIANWRKRRWDVWDPDAIRVEIEHGERFNFNAWDKVKRNADRVRELVASAQSQT